MNTTRKSTSSSGSSQYPRKTKNSGAHLRERQQVEVMEKYRKEITEKFDDGSENHQEFFVPPKNDKWTSETLSSPRTERKSSLKSPSEVSIRSRTPVNTVVHERPLKSPSEVTIRSRTPVNTVVHDIEILQRSKEIQPCKVAQIQAESEVELFPTPDFPLVRSTNSSRSASTRVSERTIRSRASTRPRSPSKPPRQSPSPPRVSRQTDIHETHTKTIQEEETLHKRSNSKYTPPQTPVSLGGSVKHGQPQYYAEGREEQVVYMTPKESRSPSRHSSHADSSFHNRYRFHSESRGTDGERRESLIGRRDDKARVSPVPSSRSQSRVSRKDRSPSISIKSKPIKVEHHYHHHPKAPKSRSPLPRVQEETVTKEVFERIVTTRKLYPSTLV